MPADGLLEFYQTVKIKYYQRVNEEAIATAKLNVNIAMIANSFGKSKFDSEKAFKESLPFNPDYLKISESNLSPETLHILGYYLHLKMIPDKILNVMRNDDQFREVLTNIIQK